jgi:hypothetical protein
MSLAPGRALDQIGDGVDGAGDELAFEDDDVGGVALQGGVQVGQGLGLRDHADIVFEGEDLLHADAIDRLGVGEDDANSSGGAGLVKARRVRVAFGAGWPLFSRVSTSSSSSGLEKVLVDHRGRHRFMPSDC